MSCQPCGCDAEANHQCEYHSKADQIRESQMAHVFIDRNLLLCQHPRTDRAELPAGAKERKQMPVASGVLFYFPDAIAEVARVSHAGNEQHNPGQPLHWAREKSTDHLDCIARHLLEVGTRDKVDGMRHSAKLAWRALANLQLEIEAERNQAEPLTGEPGQVINPNTIRGGMKL